jgi:uncharacterized protein (DUF58 family)
MTRFRERSPISHLEHTFPMPTTRTTVVVIAVLLLYLFGNQTQVGWMFVMSALLAGVVVAAWWFNRRMLRGIHVARVVGDGPNQELYEGETTTVSLTFRNTGRLLAAQVKATECCSLAALDSRKRALELFLPYLLPRRGHAYLEYSVDIDRRGVHEFPPLRLSSRAPFGFFRRRRRLDLPTRVLVYPEVRRLHHFRLLDHHLALEFTRRQAGVGTEILGVRPFQSGDSPRRVHWRSVARTGRLMCKEFADESRPGLTLVLDVCAHPYPPTASKYTPFEWAVKVAASIGDYVQRRAHPLHLLADEQVWPTPTGPVGRLPLLEYLARVQPDGQRPAASVVEGGVLPASPCVVVILPWPDGSVVPALSELRHRGMSVLALLVDPASFPAGGPSAGPLADELRASGTEARLVRYGDEWWEDLSSDRTPVPVDAYAYVHT